MFGSGMRIAFCVRLLFNKIELILSNRPRSNLINQMECLVLTAIKT